MFPSRSNLQFLLFPLIAVLTLSCAENAPGPDAIPEGVLAIVNGTPITETDLNIQLASSSRGHEEVARPDGINEVLQRIIMQELISRRALELELDQDASYQKEQEEMEARLKAFKRSRLTALYQREIRRQATVSEEVARAYFAENQARLRTKVRIWQILRRNEHEIQRDLDDLTAGISFEEVAVARFPGLPESINKPWELGLLTWHQVPDPWLQALNEMDAGETSGIITGPNNRFWIIKLVERRLDSNLTYADSETKIMEMLKSEKVKELQQQSDRELRRQATIFYPRPTLIEQSVEDY